MLNKPRRVYGFVLCLGLGMGISSAHAKNCTIAKIYRVSGIDKISILRAQGKKEQASLQNRKLCADDIVVVPQSIPHITIHYHTPRYNYKLKGGKSA
jgi:hypothetical protein